MEIKTKIELSEKDLLKIIAERFKLDPDKSKIDIYKYEGDFRESSYIKITVEGSPFSDNDSNYGLFIDERPF